MDAYVCVSVDKYAVQTQSKLATLAKVKARKKSLTLTFNKV